MATPGVGPARALATAADSRQLVEANERFEVASARERYAQAIPDWDADGIQLVGFFDDAFPDGLKTIKSPPAVLWVKGALPSNSASHVAVVGTRKPSAEGVDATRAAVSSLGGGDWVVVSGLAIGIDAAAHTSALEVHLRTIAVLGSGVDEPTPRGNIELAERILASGGCLISEQPPGTDVSAASLVQRNRLQSGLSAAVVVGEMECAGGTAHTVRFAAEQRRQLVCLTDHHGIGFGTGNRALLTLEPQKLCATLPAWRDHESLARRLGNSPLALGLSQGQPLSQLLAASPHSRPVESQGQLDLGV